MKGVTCHECVALAQMARMEAERKAAEDEAARIARKHAKIQEEAARKAEDAEKVGFGCCMVLCDVVGWPVAAMCWFARRTQMMNRRMCGADNTILGLGWRCGCSSKSILHAVGMMCVYVWRTRTNECRRTVTSPHTRRSVPRRMRWPRS
jgi:hypothetical protein